MKKIKDTFAIIFKVFIMFLLFIIISLILRFLFASITDVLVPTSSNSYEELLEHLTGSIFEDTLDIIIYTIIDCFALIIGYLIAFKNKILSKKEQNIVSVFLALEYILILCFSIAIIITMHNNYKWLFLNISSFLLIGIGLILTTILYFILCKNKMLKNIFCIIFIIGVFYTTVGVYKIKNNLNSEYISQYINESNFDIWDFYN